MAPTEKLSEYRNTFRQFQENLANFLTSAEQGDEDGEAREEAVAAAEDGMGEEEVKTFEAAAYWEELSRIADKLGFESNKICLMWIQSPLPSNKDMVAMCGALEFAGISLLSSYLRYPGVQGGKLVKHRLKVAVVDTLSNCVTFSQVLQTTTGKKLRAEEHPLMAECGRIMQSCDAIKSLPRTNSSVCVEKLLSEANMIKDALRELEEMRSENGGGGGDGDRDNDELEEDCDESWTPTDQKLINPVLGIIKTGGALVKKTCDTIKKGGKCDTEQEMREYEELVTWFAAVSPAVDDLALSLYPPLDWSESKSIAWKLKSILEEIISRMASLHFMSPVEASNWLEFVRKALQHNTAEIQRVFIEQGLAELSITSSSSPNS